MSVNKQYYEEVIASVICSKDAKISCADCYSLKKGSLCEQFKQCRISEKSQEQLEYVVSPINKDVFLEACAGSGKTEVVGLKAAYEIKKWRFKNQGIAILTFTNDATDVIKERIQEFSNGISGYPHFVGTLSSFIHQYIVQPFAYQYTGFRGRNKDYSFNLIDSDVSMHSNHWLKNYECAIYFIDSHERKYPIYANQIGYDFKRRDFYFHFWKKIWWLSEYYNSEIIQDYIRIKREEKPYFWKADYVRMKFRECKDNFFKSGFATFDDMNYLACLVLAKDNGVIGKTIAKRFPLILVDESQDLSWNEIKVLDCLKHFGTNLHFIGDLNQSIYEFKRVIPEHIEEYVSGFERMMLSDNFRSCKEIVELSKKLSKNHRSIQTNMESRFGKNSLVYIEYDNPEDAIEKYSNLLMRLKCEDWDNRILVKQNSLRRELLKAIQKDIENDEPLITAVLLWKQKNSISMKYALELAGLQISKWFGGGTTCRNYYCPQTIRSVYAWRIYLMQVLNDITSCQKLSDFNITYKEWHELGRKELKNIIQENYDILNIYDEIEDRNLKDVTKGANFKVSTKLKDSKIKMISIAKSTSIPITTIHNSKGNTFDTTLVISSKDKNSEGGHWKAHWLEGSGEYQRIGYVASTRAKFLLVWAVPKLKKGEKLILEQHGFVDVKAIVGT